jgi:hypothetical protein
MKIADAVRKYVVYRQSLGMSYKGRALRLNAFARFSGAIDLDRVTPEMVRTHRRYPCLIMEFVGIPRL